VGRLRSVLDAYGQRTGALRLLARGISPSVIRPLDIAERDQSTAHTRSGTLFAMLPYFFIRGAFIGGMALAIDTTAGARARQSLEPLRVNPVPRSRIRLGKLAATSAVALTSVLLSIIAFSVVGRFMPTEERSDCMYCDFRTCCRVTTIRNETHSPLAAWARNLAPIPDEYRALVELRGRFK
jgi:sodium transport system permease protein